MSAPDENIQRRKTKKWEPGTNLSGNVGRYSTKNKDIENIWLTTWKACLLGKV